MNPAGTAERLGPTLVIRHVVPVAHHHGGQPAPCRDGLSEGPIVAGAINEHVPLGTRHQVAAGPETAPCRPAAVGHLASRVAGNQGGKSLGRGLAQQGWRGADGGHGTGLHGHECPCRLRPGLGLGPDPGLVAMVLEVLGIPLPAGAAVNATAVHVERSAHVFRAAFSEAGHGEQRGSIRGFQPILIMTSTLTPIRSCAGRLKTSLKNRPRHWPQGADPGSDGGLVQHSTRPTKALLNPGVQVQVFKKLLDLPLLWQLTDL